MMINDDCMDKVMMWSAYANGELACLAMFQATLALSSPPHIDMKVLDGSPHKDSSLEISQFCFGPYNL